MGVVAVAEHGDIDQVRRRRVLPDLAIDADEIDVLVEPAAGPVGASVGNEVREAADVLVVPRLSRLPRLPPWRASRRDLFGTGEKAAPGDRLLRACARRAGCGSAIR